MESKQIKYMLVDTANKPGYHPQDKELEDKSYLLLHQALPVGDYCLASQQYWDMYLLHSKEEFVNCRLHGGNPLNRVKISRLDLAGSYSTAVDVKQSMKELCSNLLYTRKGARYRFERELAKAKNLGIKLYIVIADDSIQCEDDLLSYVSTAGKACGPDMKNRILELTEQYGCSFYFVKKEELTDEILRCLGELDSESGGKNHE